MTWRRADDEYGAYAWHFLGMFRAATRQLKASVDELEVALRHGRCFCEGLGETSDPDGRAACDSMKRLLGGMTLVLYDQPWVRLADISGCEQLMEEPNAEWLKLPRADADWIKCMARVHSNAFLAANQDLLAQLRTVRESACLFFAEGKQRQFVHENNLVRAGPLLNGFLKDSLPGTLIAYLARRGFDRATELVVAQRKFAGAYRSLLAAFDVFAALQKPQKVDFEERLRANRSVVERAIEAKNDPEYGPIRQQALVLR